jgi:hypothetical protein
MAARRILIMTLAVAMQLLAWREAVPVCASMTHCGGGSPPAGGSEQVRSQSSPATTISGTAACCRGGSVEARTAASPMPQRVLPVAPAIASATLAIAPPETTLGVRNRATADASPPLPPLLGSCILRI